MRCTVRDSMSMHFGVNEVGGYYKWAGSTIETAATSGVMTSRLGPSHSLLELLSWEWFQGISAVRVCWRLGLILSPEPFPVGISEQRSRFVHDRRHLGMNFHLYRNNGEIHSLKIVSIELVLSSMSLWCDYQLILKSRLCISLEPAWEPARSDPEKCGNIAKLSTPRAETPARSWFSGYTH